eukprot:COSAG01_NODE_59998_length_297_cov_0.595960_1_plen_81_part_10
MVTVSLISHLRPAGHALPGLAVDVVGLAAAAEVVQHHAMIRTEYTMPVDVGESQPTVIVVSLISHLWRPRSCSTTAFMSVS